MKTIAYEGRSYEVSVRAPSFGGGFSASFSSGSLLHSIRGAASEDAAIKELEEQILPEQEKWEREHPEWGEIPRGVVLGKALPGWPCKWCGGMIHLTNVAGVKTCERCGESTDVVGDYTSRHTVTRHATKPESIAQDEAIAGMFA